MSADSYTPLPQSRIQREGTSSPRRASHPYIVDEHQYRAIREYFEDPPRIPELPPITLPPSPGRTAEASPSLGCQPFPGGPQRKASYYPEADVQGPKPAGPPKPLCIPEPMPIMNRINRDLADLHPRMVVRYFFNFDDMLAQYDREVLENEQKEFVRAGVNARRNASGAEGLREFSLLVPLIHFRWLTSTRGFRYPSTRTQPLRFAISNHGRPNARHTHHRVDVHRATLPDRYVELSLPRPFVC